MSTELALSAEVTLVKRDMFTESLVASAVRFLAEGGERDAARLLALCSLEDPRQEDWQSGEIYVPSELRLCLRAPRMSYDVLVDDRHPISQAVHAALEAVLPHDSRISEFRVRAELVEIDAHWREELLAVLRGEDINNQAATIEKARLWQNLRFRSATEVKVGQALDRAKVLIFPLCRARLNAPEGRVNREPDFLVCHEGRWGILEVDGEPYHPSTRTVEDHRRDRLFKAHGVRVVEHFDAKECYESPDTVVARFLDILKSS